MGGCYKCLLCKDETHSILYIAVCNAGYYRSRSDCFLCPGNTIKTRAGNAWTCSLDPACDGVKTVPIQNYTACGKLIFYNSSLICSYLFELMTFFIDMRLSFWLQNVTLVTMAILVQVVHCVLVAWSKQNRVMHQTVILNVRLHTPNQILITPNVVIISPSQFVSCQEKLHFFLKCVTSDREPLFGPCIGKV